MSGNTGSFQVFLLIQVEVCEISALEEDSAECLLRVGNRCILDLQMAMLEEAGFGEANVVCPQGLSNSIRTWVANYDGKMRLSMHVFESTLGSAEILFSLREQITRDFIVILGNIVSDNFLCSMVNMHRLKDPTVTMLVSKVAIQKNAKSKDEKKNEGSRDVFGLSSDNRIVYFKADDLYGMHIHGDNIKIHKKLLSRFSDLRLRNDYVNNEVYVFSHSVLTLFEGKETEGFTSIHRDLIPHLVKHQFTSKYADRMSAVEHNNFGLAYAMSSSDKNMKDELRCYMFPFTSPNLTRITTIEEYKAYNRAVISGKASFEPREKKHQRGKLVSYVSDSAKISSETRLGQCSVVGKESRIGGSCAFKLSSVGRHCVIGDKCKIVNSLIMSYVNIGEGCVVKNSVICSNATLAPGTQVANSVIACKAETAEGQKISNTTFTGE